MPSSIALRSSSASSVAAEFQAVLGELLADFVEASNAEVFALQQVVAGLAEQLANGVQAETDHALAGTHRKVEVGNGAVEQRLFVGAEGLRLEGGLGGRLFGGQLAERQAL